MSGTDHAVTGREPRASPRTPLRRALRSLLAVIIAVPVFAVTAFVVVAIRFRPPGPHMSPAAVEREIARLTRERDSLRTIVWAAADRSELLARRPSGDVVIGLPTPFVNALVQDIVTGWFHDVEVRLHDVHVHKAGVVRAKMGIFGRHEVGNYDMDLTLDDVRGRMTAGEPVLTFGGDRIGVVLPVRVTGGTVKATIAIAWESMGLAAPVCGDFAAIREVTGTVRPADHTAHGRIVLSARDGAIVADPDFPALAVRLFPDPAAASVAVLDSLLDKKGGLCGIAVGKAKTGDKILALVGRGFNVRIPQKFFRPVTLPIAIERSAALPAGHLALEVRPSGLAVTPATVWLAADVSIGSRTSGATGPRSPRNSRPIP